jgi:hypothetical protein
MKRTVFSIVVTLVLGALFFGCGGGKATIRTPSGGDVPEWYLNPEELIEAKYGSEESYFFGTGQATKVVPSLAKTASEARALSELTRQVNLEVKSKVQDYMAQSGAAEGNPGVLEFTEAVTKQLAKAKMTGAKIIKRAVSKDGRTYYALAVYSLNAAQRLAAQMIAQEKNKYMGNEEALFNEFKARQAFESLDADDISTGMGATGGENPER